MSVIGSFFTMAALSSPGFSVLLGACRPTPAPAPARNVEPAPVAEANARLEPEPLAPAIEEPQAPDQDDPSMSPALREFPGPGAGRLLDGHLVVSWGRDVAVSSPYGVVTSVEDHATQAGVAILRAGGNAVDAAVATALALAVTHPSAGSLGGGGFLLAKVGSVIEAIDFREDSPGALTTENFWDMIRRGAKGPRAVGVPGTVYGLHLAHERLGALPWSTVVAPALRLAKDGFLLGLRQAQTLIWAEHDFAQDPVARQTFYSQKPWQGVRVTQPKLALALERIAEHGRDGFYRGPTAEDLVASLGETGLMTLGDLEAYRAKVRDPLYFDFYDFRVVTMPPPSAGGVAVAQNLLMLQQMDVASLSKFGGRRVQLIAEASRRSQVERQYFVVSPDELSPEREEAERRRALDPMTWLADHPIDPTRPTQSSTLHPAYRRAVSELPHTTQLSVVDGNGNAVSCTVTLSGSFGARIMTRETGIVLNNSVASFSSTGQNTPAAGQRTTSSMAPTLAFLDLDHFLVLGSPGGNTIPNTITQTFVHLALDDDSLDEAVRRPRVHQGFAPQYLQMERYAPLPQSVQTQLRNMGYDLRFERQTMGDANIAAFVSGVAYAVADPREGGLASAPTALDNSTDETTEDANLVGSRQ